jgi:hypothetical protein
MPWCALLLVMLPWATYIVVAVGLSLKASKHRVRDFGTWGWGAFNPDSYDQTGAEYLKIFLWMSVGMIPVAVLLNLFGAIVCGR